MPPRRRTRPARCHFAEAYRCTTGHSVPGELSHRIPHGGAVHEVTVGAQDAPPEHWTFELCEEHALVIGALAARRATPVAVRPPASFA